MLRARIYLHGVLPLLESVVVFDRTAARRIAGRSIVIQFEVKKGPVAHLVVDFGRIAHGAGAHDHPDIRLRFRTPQMLNRMFAGEKARPGLRKGFRHLRFLLRDFPALADRLGYYLEGDGSSGEGSSGSELRFLVGLRLRALLGGSAVIAEHDGWLADVADRMPAGVLLMTVAPDGPGGTLEKVAAPGPARFRSTFDGGDTPASVLMEFAALDDAWSVLSGKTGFEEAASLGHVEMTGNLILAEQCNIFMRRLVAIMGM